jgi:hypothetical protein
MTPATTIGTARIGAPAGAPTSAANYRGSRAIRWANARLRLSFLANYTYKQWLKFA